jgi:hypothetical protein
MADGPAEPLERNEPNSLTGQVLEEMIARLAIWGKVAKLAILVM